MPVTPEATPGALLGWGAGELTKRKADREKVCIIWFKNYPIFMFSWNASTHLSLPGPSNFYSSDLGSVMSLESFPKGLALLPAERDPPAAWI